MLERPIGTVIAGYRIDEVVGRGGMGVVYRAMDVLLERPVALKVIVPELARDPSFRTRFTRELKFVASIDHPNVIPVHHAGEEDGDLFIAMRFVRGTDLRAMIYHYRALSPERAVAVVGQVANALDAAHALGLVHRDVKPANVLIADRAGVDHVYLTDFGLSKHATSAPGLTQTGQFVGTVDYVAPEQIRGERVDERADIYALGCVLFHALTGQPPFARESDAAKLWAHMHDVVPSARDIDPNVPAGFDDVLRRALDKDPAGRFKSARELREAAAAALQPANGETVAGGLMVPTGDTPPTLPVPQPPAAGFARPPPSPPPGGPAAAVPADPEKPRPERRSPRTFVALAAAGLVVIAVVAAVLLAGGDDDGSGSEQAAVGPATELPADLAWQPVDKLPYKRQYAAATAVDGQIWLFGGIRTNRSGTGTQFYNPADGTWTTGPGLQKPLHHFSAVNYNGEAVVIGGFVPGAELTSGQSNSVYVLRAGDWQPLPSLKYKRAAAAAAVVGDKIVVVGGQADGKLVPQTEVYDGEGWTVVADIPTPREHLGAASDGRYLYAAGGNDLASDTKSAAFERYDPETNEWTPLDDMPEALKGVGAGFAGGRIVAVGGEDLTAVSDAVYGYDIRGREWSPLPRLPNPRHGVALTEVGDSLYAIGGATAPGHAGPTDAVDLLDLSGGAAAPVPEHDAWRTVGDALSDVQYAATAVDDRIWLFGGIDANGNATAASATYDSVINNWTPQTRLPRPVHHAAAVAYEGDPVVIGGSVAGGASDGVYALRDDEWVKRPSLNHPRWAAAAAVVGDKIVVTGGEADGKLVQETEVFDGRQWRDVEPMPTPREHLGAASDERFVYAVGGRKGSADTNLGTLERYDPATDEWTTLPSMREITGAVGVAYVAGQVVAVGGERPNTVFDTVQAYDVRRQAWSELPSLPEPRHGVAVAAFRNSLFAIGGAAEPGHFESTRDVNVLRFE